MFRGVFEHTLDSKGRVSIPSRFRGQLETGEGLRVMMTRGLHRNLVLYPLPRWLIFEERILAQSQFDPVIIRAKRIFVSRATECTLDSQGRILISPLMRKHAQLEKEVIWVGQLDTFELWSQHLWEQAYEDALSVETALTLDDELARALARLGL